MASVLPLLIVFIVALFTKNNLLAAASAIVFFCNLMRLHSFLPLIQTRGLEAGLLLLTISLLIPFSTGEVTLKNIIRSLWSPLGLLAIVGGLLGAFLNSQGLSLVTVEPTIIPGILIGVIISVFFFGGISVGPIMAAGITALLARFFLP
ncbi:MAG: DUF441 domain-containing protein [Firmicutes bacterium]|nr:DUF441 domain-containing protein [Bacillota bacterium]